MNRTLGLLAAATLLSVAFATVVFAQQAPTSEGVVIKQRVMQGPEGGPPPPPDANFMFIASESFNGKVVKGAPYSADAVTESIQTLGDGNRIVNRFNSSVYRDSEGRTRREQTLKGLGPIGGSDEQLQTIFINDPVAGVNYALDTRSKVAHKSAPFTFTMATKPPPGVQGGEQRFDLKVAPGPGAPPAAGNVVIATAQMAVPPPGAPMPHGEGEFTMRTEAGATTTFFFKNKAGSNANEVQEQLGKQTIEGVDAEGTRTTITIPAGEIGNERPIEIVNERWYSEELQLVVMTRHSDPRTGETTYKLTNINRAEPAKSLFEVPAGYTVKEGPHFGPPMVGPLMRTRKPGNPE